MSFLYVCINVFGPGQIFNDFFPGFGKVCFQVTDAILYYQIGFVAIKHIELKFTLRILNVLDPLL